MSELSLAQKDRLTVLEGVIEEGLNDFLDVGHALAAVKEEKLRRFLAVSAALLEIRDSGLCGEDFHAYLKRRWGWGQSRRYQLLVAAETVTALSTRVEPARLPPTEKHCRAIGALTDDEKVAVIHEGIEANGGVMPSASRLKELADKAVAGRGKSPAEQREEIRKNERAVLGRAVREPTAEEVLAKWVVKKLEACKRRIVAKYGEEAARPFCRAIDTAFQHLTRL